MFGYDNFFEWDTVIESSPKSVYKSLKYTNWLKNSRNSLSRLFVLTSNWCIERLFCNTRSGPLLAEFFSIATSQRHKWNQLYFGCCWAVCVPQEQMWWLCKYKLLGSPSIARTLPPDYVGHYMPGRLFCSQTCLRRLSTGCLWGIYV